MTTIPIGDRVGLAVMDIQVLHDGHYRMLNRLRATCGVAILGLGSVRKHGVPGHPFTSDERRTMVDALFGPGVFATVDLDDIDTEPDESAWSDYVLSKCAAAGLPRPTDYFTGSRDDATWYVHAFAPLDGDPFETSESRVYSGSDGRRLHVIEREGAGIPSGRLIRDMIERRDGNWRRFVPERLHGWIEANYPGPLRRPLGGTGFPDAAGLPTGTRFVFDPGAGPEGVYDLKDDRAWRVLKPDIDPKAVHAERTRADWATQQQQQQ